LLQCCSNFVFLKKNATMKNLKQLRIKLGLTQEEIAQYLKINRSLWSLCELQLRDLPTHALVKLAEMEMFLLQFNEKPNKFLPLEAEQLQKAIEFFEQHQKKMAYQQMVLQKKLESLRANYQYNIQLLAFLNMKEEKNNDLDALEKSWIAMMKTTALRAIEANGLHQQAKINIELRKYMPQNKTDFIDNFKLLMDKLIG
jgi:transcriptional regulator with XRE-family HTH domain